MERKGEDVCEHLCIAESLVHNGCTAYIDWDLYCWLMSWDSQQGLYKQLSKQEVVCNELPFTPIIHRYKKYEVQ